MDHGSIWGHGSLRGMDFSAYTLHLMGYLVRNYHLAKGQPPDDLWQKLPPPPRKELDEVDMTVIRELKENRYKPETGTLELTAAPA